jgi:DNA-binding Lrp family transcriptional regulator
MHKDHLEKMVLLDNTDINIVELLSRDSSLAPTQISKDLAKRGISLTPRSILNRLKRLDKQIIQGYTVILNPTLFESKYSVLILLKFVPSCNNDEVEKLNSILCDSPNCSFASRMFGGAADGYDCAYHLVYDTEQQFNLQFGLILDTFKGMIEHYQNYKSVIKKESPRSLRPTHDLGRDKMSMYVNKQSMYDPEYQRKIINQGYDEMVRSYVKQHHQILDEY